MHFKRKQQKKFMWYKSNAHSVFIAHIFLQDYLLFIASNNNLLKRYEEFRKYVNSTA